MSDISLQINEQEVVVKEGTTILEAAKHAGISIPTLCHHDKLKPYGGCRLCIVEAQSRGKTTMVASCVYPAESGMVIKTSTQKIKKIRKTLLELLLAHSPDSPQLQELAKEYGADKERYDKESSFCIHCGLCVRYCAEIKKKNALGFVNRGTKKEISFIPEIASKECEACKECFPLCPTSYLQAAYVLAKSLTQLTQMP